MTGSRVLVVDDDQALLEALPETVRLRIDGVAVEVAESAPIALERIKAVDYDAIVTDIKMPGMDGLALLEQIRQARPETPTILITGHGEHDMAIQAIRRGAYDYIPKPIDRDYFIASLNRALEVRRLSRQLGEQQKALERHASELEERIRALTEAAAGIHRARGVREVIQSVAEAARRLGGGLSFAGFQRRTQQQDSAGGWEMAASPPEAAASLDELGVPSLFALALEGRGIVRADEVVAGVRNAESSLPRPLASYVVVPLMGRMGETLGAIFLGHPEPNRFHRQLTQEVEALAMQAAVAIENALLYERQRGIAETLQLSLLPDHLPSIPGIALAARYIPGSPEAVGGDWYDVFPFPGGRVGLVMGDVAGRGVRAAAIMGQLRNALRAYALEGHPPTRVAEQMRRLVDSGQMATLLYVIFDPTDWSLLYTNLGHLPPIVLGPDGEVTVLEGGSPPLGTQMVPPPVQHTATMAPGSTIVLFTDGLVEVRGEPIDEGLQRLSRALRGRTTNDLDGLLGEVISEVRDPDSAHDDIAVLALRASSLDPARLQLRLPALPSSLPMMRHSLRRWLQLLHLGEMEAYEINLSACEAFANAIEHAYGAQDGQIEIEATSLGGTVEVTVRDWGRWRPQRGEHRGRGLTLIQALMDDLDITDEHGGTTVTMRRRLHREVVG